MSATLADLRPGDIMFTKIGGFVPGFFPVRVGQWLLARTSPEERYINHVAVVTSVERVTEHNYVVMIVQAMPSGAEEVQIKQTFTGHYDPNMIFLRPDYMPDRSGRFVGQDHWVAEAARQYVGTSYSFLDYLSIAGLHAGVDNGRVRRYVKSSGHMICSQLADQALADAGFHVFDDGRLPQDVMPVELYRALAAMRGTQLLSAADPDAGWARVS